MEPNVCMILDFQEVKYANYHQQWPLVLHLPITLGISYGFDFDLPHAQTNLWLFQSTWWKDHVDCKLITTSHWVCVEGRKGERRCEKGVWWHCTLVEVWISKVSTIQVDMTRTTHKKAHLCEPPKNYFSCGSGIPPIILRLWIPPITLRLVLLCHQVPCKHRWTLSQSCHLLQIPAQTHIQSTLIEKDKENHWFFHNSSAFFPSSSSLPPLSTCS